MRCCMVLAACLVTAGTIAAPANAEFTFTTGEKHVSASVFDFTGTDSFSLTEPIALGFDVLVDNADSPGDWTSSGAAALTDVSSSHIGVSGDAMGHTAVEAGPPSMSALTELTLTFTVKSTKLAHWEFLTIEPTGAFASITLVGPGGLVPAGDVILLPGEYTITASAGYTDFPILPVDDTIHARYYGDLKNIPTPGAMVVLAVAGAVRRGRRRR